MIRLFSFIFFITPAILFSQYSITTIDFLKKANLNYNAGGPMLLTTDINRNRVISVNTHTSSLSVINCEDHSVKNIPLEGRGLQHLKSDALRLNDKTGDICFIGDKYIFIVNPDTKKATNIKTEKQYESIAIDSKRNKYYFTGREDEGIFVIDQSLKTKTIEWLNNNKKLENENQTPPPPIRKIIYSSKLDKIIAIDGYEAKMYFINPENDEIINERALSIEKGGRWHLAGLNDSLNCLYIVQETSKRKVNQAAMVSLVTNNDIIITMPEGFSEPAGICSNSKLNEVYIPYDNNRSVHVVDFNNKGDIVEIAIPSFGNDAGSVDILNDILYVASWAEGEVYVIDLKERAFKKSIRNLGIIPHMFAMTFNPSNNKLYFPIGASAVNGNFGSAITALDPLYEKTRKIYLGWLPIDIHYNKKNNSVFVFNNEDEMCIIDSTLNTNYIYLPYNFPIISHESPKGNIYLSYGPHQSYWPTVYIWGAKNGIITINTDYTDNYISLKTANTSDPFCFKSVGPHRELFCDMFYDRRIPRQALQLALDNTGKLFMPQNNWGREEQFMNILIDEVRYNEIGHRIKIIDTVDRETTQRIMKYDPKRNLIYLVKLAEKADENGTFYIISADSSKEIFRSNTGITPTDMIFTDDKVYISNFDSKSITVYNHSNQTTENIEVPYKPLKIIHLNNNIYITGYDKGCIYNISSEDEFILPVSGNPDYLTEWDNKLVVMSRNKDNINVITFDPESKSFHIVKTDKYPFGNCSFDTENSAFYVRGQYGDAIYNLSKSIIDKFGRLWISDFLSGKLHIIEKI